MERPYAGGASNDNGVAFQLTPAGAYKVIFYFDLSEEYAFPAAALLEGSPGVFYSVASAGGDANKGVVYQLTSTGSFSFLHSFAEDGSEGTSPQSALIKGPNGDLYSTVAQGGTGDAGTIYQVTTGGTLSVLDELANPTGETPVAALTAAPNGSFYGITSHGGAYLKGTIFRITTAGVTSVVPHLHRTGWQGANGFLAAGQRRQFLRHHLRGRYLQQRHGFQADPGRSADPLCIASAL